MGRTLRKIADDALALPEQDRLALAAELIDSVEGPEDAEWSEAWSAELDRRVAEAERTGDRGRPGTPYAPSCSSACRADDSAEPPARSSAGGGGGHRLVRVPVPPASGSSSSTHWTWPCGPSGNRRSPSRRGRSTTTIGARCSTDSRTSCSSACRPQAPKLSPSRMQGGGLDTGSAVPDHERRPGLPRTHARAAGSWPRNRAHRSTPAQQHS